MFTTCNCPDDKVLNAELREFLKTYDFLDGTPGTHGCILMSSKLTKERFDTLIKLIVKEWIEKGITKTSEFETLKGMKLWEVVIMVKKHLEYHLRAMGEVVGS
ncbi:hypothetical protein BGX38DRAFT_1270259 [Terfezia claveryi]|nr:hypothetical protein BGX38DRAFT_1270259 [Terfezia claveryi]